MSVPRMRRVAPFDPTQVAGCALWLDANDASTVTGTTNVTNVRDKSTNAYNLVPGSGTTSYASNAITINSSYLYATGAVDLTTFTFFIVAKNIGTSYNQPFFGALPNIAASTFDSTDGFGWYMDNGNSTRFFGRYINNTGQWITTSINTLNIGLYAVTGTSGGVYTQWNNGTLGNTVTSSSRTSTGRGFTVGGEWYGPGSTYYTYTNSGSIYEVVVYNTVLSTAQQQQIEGYLAQKWSLKNTLPGGHPGITTTIYPTPRTLSMTPRQYPASYNPTTVAGCCLWLDGADSTSTSAITSGTWYDKSSFASNATAYAGGSSFSMGSINGLSAVTFSSAANAFVANTTLSTSGFSIFFVVRITSLSGNGTRFVMSGEGYGLQIYALSASFPFQLGTYVYSFFPSNNTSISQNAIFIYSVTIGPSLYYQWINGVANSSSGSGNLSLSSIYIGNVNGPTDSTLAFVGQMGEFLVYNSSLTDPQRQTIEGYLASKWSLQGSLPSDHPYKSAAPTVGGNIFNISRQALPSALFPTPKTNTGPIPLYPSYTNTNGLVSFFLFDNTIADVRNTITLAQTGSISYVTGRINQALSLTNTSGVAPTNYLTSTYAFPSTFTISLWFQAPDVSPAQAIVYTNSTPAFVLGSAAIYFAGGNLYCAYGSVANNVTGYPISANTWYNGIITYNNGTLALYANGTKSGSDVTGTNSKNGFTLGASTDPGPTYYPFTGYIDEVRIYNRVLSGSEITAIYNGTG